MIDTIMPMIPTEVMIDFSFLKVWKFLRINFLICCLVRIYFPLCEKVMMFHFFRIFFNKCFEKEIESLNMTVIIKV